MIANGNELTIAADQVVWEEDGDVMSAAAVYGAGAVTRATNDFTINNTAIPADAYDIDSSRPTVAEWVQVKVGMEFAVFDSLGKKNYAKITAITSDRKTFTATPIGGAWTVGTTNLSVYFTGNNLDHCELAPCVGYKSYNPTRENSMFKDSECHDYCEETEIANGVEGGDAYTLFKSPVGNMYVDDKLTEKQRLLTQKTDYAFAHAVRQTAVEAGSRPRGTNGILTILEKRALKNEGMIETLQDAKNLAANLRTMKVKKATLRCSNEQFTKLVDLFPMGSTYSIDPFVDRNNSLFYIGYKGFQIGDVTIIFKQWSALDNADPNIGKRYHYVVIPEGRLKRKINNRIYDVGYLNIGWFGKANKVYKYMREEDRKVGGKVTVHFVNKFVPIVFHPEKFILGITL